MHVGVVKQFRDKAFYHLLDIRKLCECHSQSYLVDRHDGKALAKRDRSLLEFFEV